MMNSQNSVRLQYEDKEIVLLGTAHVSNESAEEVAHWIEKERPDTVCIELCDSRYQTMTQKKQWQDRDFVKVIRE